jgi:hypothetical protein
MREEFDLTGEGYYRREQDYKAADAIVDLSATYREHGQPRIEIRLLDPGAPEGKYSWSAGYFISPEDAQKFALWLLEKVTLANVYVEKRRLEDALRSAKEDEK